MTALLARHSLTRIYVAACSVIAVISVSYGLTAWTNGRLLWFTRAGQRETWPAADTEAAAAHLAALARPRRAASLTAYRAPRAPGSCTAGTRIEEDAPASWVCALARRHPTCRYDDTNRIQNRFTKSVPWKPRPSGRGMKTERHAALMFDLRPGIGHPVRVRTAYRCRAYPGETQVRNMVRNRSLARAISCTGWAEFRSMLEYKAERCGRMVVAVDRWYPSSKTCSACGHLLAELSLGTRYWACPACGTRHDRDVNAAKNILAAGLAVIACGGDVRRAGATRTRPPVKQEL